MKSITTKIIFTFLLLQLLILSLIGLYLRTNIKGIFYDQLDQSMMSQVKLLRELVTVDLSADNYEGLEGKSRRFAGEIKGRVTVIAKDGKVLADSDDSPERMENHSKRPEVIEARNLGYGWATRYSATLKMEMRYLALEMPRYGYVRVAIPLTIIHQRLMNIFFRLLVGFAVAFSLFTLLAWQVIKGITEPVKQITRTAQEIAHGKLDERINVQSKDEIGTLSEMFNLMAQQLSDTIRNISNEKERLTTILKNMADGLIALDATGKILLINPAAAQIFDVAEDIKGKYLIEVNRNQQLTDSLQRVYQTGELIDTEIQLIYPREIILHAHIAPIKGAERIQGVVLIFTDVSELRRLERIRTEFVGNVSHELKTPLTSIRGYVETLLDMDVEDPLVSKFLKVINKESQRLARLINDLLDLSKLEARRHHQLAPTRLIDVVENVIYVLAPEAEKKKIELTIDLPLNLPRVMGVEEQLDQVLINLMDNGIKYTPAGGEVVLSAEADEHWVTIKVTDNGCGIPAEDLERIFERFYRVDKARSRQAGGTGLGLSIVKHIVKAHGGDIQVESEPGVGSTFIVKLKRAEG